MRYRQVTAVRPGGPEVLQVVEREFNDLAAGEVRVKVLAAGVAFGDLLWQSGAVPGGPKPPFAPGYDLVGVVEEVGAGVVDLQLGQPVAALAGLDGYGGYTEYRAIAEKYLAPLPSGVGPAAAAAAVLNYLTAYQVYHRIARLRAGDRILIHGAGGGVGTAFLDLGRLIGLETYGTASLAKHDLVAGFGATPIDYRSKDFVARIAELAPGGLDLVVDHIGGAHLARSFKTLRPGGYLLATSGYGAARGDASRLETILGFLRVMLWNLLPNSRRALIFDILAHYKKNNADYCQDLTAVLAYLAEGKIDPVIAARFPLSQARQAQEMLLNAEARGKVVLLME